MHCRIVSVSLTGAFIHTFVQFDRGMISFSILVCYILVMSLKIQDVAPSI